MARDGSGNYTNALPDVIAGDVIEAAWANTSLDDIGVEIQDSLSRSGKGNMSAALKVIAGSVAAPGLSFVSEANSGLYRAGAADIRMALGAAEAFRVTSAGLRTAGALTVATSDLTMTAGNLIPATAGKGVDFAAQTATAATGAATTKEILTHYEEGTWTPNLWDSSDSSSEGQGYITQAGFFTRIGRLVHVNGTMVVSSVGTLTASSPVRVGPLPFTSAAGGGNNYSAMSIVASNLNLAGIYAVTGQIASTQNHFALLKYASATAGASALLISEIDAGSLCTVTFSGHYFV